MKLGSSVISTLVIVGFVIVLVLLIAKPINISDQMASILNILIGTLSAKFGDVVQYHIGSSAGSREKNNMIKGVIQPPNG